MIIIINVMIVCIVIDIIIIIIISIIVTFSLRGAFQQIIVVWLSLLMV